MLLGADADSGACSRAWKALGRAGEKIHGRSEQDFRRSPTAANFGKMLEAKVFIQQIGGDSEPRPTGWKAAGGVAYVVKTGDSLAGISKQFYGSPGYWDIIYMENAGAIGNNPEKIQVGLKLVIP